MTANLLINERLYVAQEMAAAEIASFAGGGVAVFSTHCPTRDNVCEDAAVTVETDSASGVLAIADGLGGHAAGERAAEIALDTLRRIIIAATTESRPLRAAILDGIEEANRAVMGLGTGGGTTLAVVEVQPEAIRSYHVGDSAVMVFGGRGKLKFQTVDHSPVGYAVEAALLAREEALAHDERHLVSNIVGSPEMHVTISSTVPIRPRDTVVLATDGVTDNLRQEEIIARARKGPLAEVAGNLVADALRRMQQPADDHPSKPDDLTFIVYRPRV